MLLGRMLTPAQVFLGEWHVRADDSGVGGLLSRLIGRELSILMKPPPRYCAPAGVAGPRSGGQRADAYNYLSTERYTIFKAACPSKAVDRTKDLPWRKGLALDST